MAARKGHLAGQLDFTFDNRSEKAKKDKHKTTDEKKLKPHLRIETTVPKSKKVKKEEELEITLTAGEPEEIEPEESKQQLQRRRKKPIA